MEITFQRFQTWKWG